MNKSKLKSKIAKLAVTGAFVAFASSGVVAANAGETGKPAGDAARGVVSWGQNCTRCHEMRDPAEFRDDMWRPIMSHMRLRAGLTGQQQRDILAFLQSSNNPAPMKATSPTATEKTSGPALSGKEIYNQTCIACHGANGAGAFPGTPDFTKPDGRLSKPDDVLFNNIVNGFQSPGSAMSMPAKGGNPNLTEADVQAVLKFLRESFGK